MKRLALLLAPAIAFCGQTRYARLGEFDGTVDVQLAAADPWQPALRNLPLVESACIRTGAASRAEVELDEGTSVRLAATSQAELSDYTRLSTGQRVTLVSLDHGVAYLTGLAEGRDALLFAIPGAQITIARGTRLRFEAAETWSQVSVIEGSVKFSSPAAEIDLHEGQVARVEPAHPDKFYLYREIAPMESDSWSEERDKAQASSISVAHVPDVKYGLTDLDHSGTWVDSKLYGTVWKPKVQEGWVPFREGKWQWYDAIGYTWISADPWGWLPYHYGRWAQQDSTGWVWVPGKSAIFKPGDVYWIRGKDLAGWGPLAPEENWTPDKVPALYSIANTTCAKFVFDAREVDPAGFAKPKDPLAVAGFTPALPSPLFLASRLTAVRPELRAGSTRVVPVLAGASYGAPLPPAPASQPNVEVIQPPPAQPTVVTSAPAPEPPPPPAVIYYPAPVATEVIVIDPPDRDHRRRRPQQPQAATPPPAPAKPAAPPVSRTEEHQRRQTAPPPTAAPAPVPAAPPVSRTEEHQRRQTPPPAPAPLPTPAAAPAPAPVVRTEQQQRRQDPPPPADQQPESKPAVVRSNEGRRNQ